MLVKKNEIIEALKTFDEVFNNSELECWVKSEDKFEVYIFSLYTTTETELADGWKNLNDLIAIHFQSKLSKSVERWNIYTVFIVKDKVSTELKYAIEQDKYATRKVVVDEVQKPKRVDELISKKLFDVDIASSETEENPNEEEAVLDLIRERDTLLYNLIKQKNIKPKEIFQKYIEVGK